MISADDAALMEAEIAAAIQAEEINESESVPVEEVNNVQENMENSGEVISEQNAEQMEQNEDVVLSQSLVQEGEGEVITEGEEAVLNDTTEAIEQVEQVERSEPVEAIEQVEQVERSEPVEAIEQTESIEHAEPVEPVEPVEDSNDGPRAKHLKQALRKALNNTIKSCSGEKLETCFPFNLKANQMGSINATIIQSLQSVIEGVQKPFEELIVSEGLVEKLNKVDEFTRLRAPNASAAGECASSLADLTPQNLIDRRLYATKLSALNQLEAHLKEIENENSNLAAELNSRQSTFVERLDRLKSSQQLLDLALDQISQVPMEEMESLVDKMNHQYQPGVISLPKIKLTE